MEKIRIRDNITDDNTVNILGSLLVYTQDNKLHNMGNIYRTILHFIIQLIHFKICRCVYRICSDRT